MNLDALEFNNHFLNQIIFHSIQDTEFISKIRQIIPVSIFKAKEKEIIIKMIYNFYDDFKTAPGENFFDIFQEQEKNMSEDLYNRCINFIGVLKDITGSNPEYILRNINDAIYHFQLEEASINFATLIKNKKYDEAKGVILKAIKEKPIEQPYYDFFTDNSFIDERLNKRRYKMKTKIPKLDEMIGKFEKPKSHNEFMNHLKSTFKIPVIRFSGKTKKVYSRIAVCGGSGSYLIKKAIQENADAFLTSDIKYHQFFETEQKLLLCDIGHYESEQFTKEIFYELLNKKISTFAVHLSSIVTNPIKYFT